MKKNLLMLAAFVLSGAMLSCSSSSDDVDELGETKQVVNMLSEAKPIQLTDAQKLFVNDNNYFSRNFLKTANETDQSGKSFIYSPLSITYVLGMVNDAAIGQTEQELEQTLGFREGGIQAVNEYCKKLIDNLPKVDEKVTLNIANAIFVNKNNATLKAKYQQDMLNYYDAKAEDLDFDAPETLGHINGWCKEKTKDMIPTILDKVNPDAVSYLLNAIYFKADWASKFDPKHTKEETFTTEKGETKLPLMHQNVLIEYMKLGLYSAVKIPYGNGMWNMTILLPEEGITIDDVIDNFKSYGLSGGWRCGVGTDTSAPTFSAYEVDLKLPRFEIASDTDDLDGKLIGLLKKMGIHLAFDSDFAEIPNMCDGGNVYISMMRQKAKIKVNEEGSEAAAVTIAGVYGTTSLDSGPVSYPKATFHANHPFVYVITEASSGVILFVGKFTGE